MIDLHCHVLPGLDDGAADVDDSVTMARQAAADGVRAICATPHIRHDHDVVIGELSARVEAVNRELERRAVECRILRGGEVAETAVAGLANQELATVALGGAWVLLEPAPGPLSDSLAAAVDALGERGYGSLVAHPERHLAPDLPERLRALIERGALVQATAATFVDPRTRRYMSELSAGGLVHVLGSDAHSSRFGRPPTLSDAFGQIDRRRVGWMRDVAPAAIVAGEAVERPF